MNIQITKNVEQANCITHSGKFHCDEVFATIIMSKFLEEVILCRVQDISNIKTNQYIYDIGKGELDHHQIEGNGKRENGILYSSCGLVWKKFGKEILKKYKAEEIEYAFEIIDRDLIQGIDAFDNGQIPKIDVEYRIMNITKIIEDFNANWDEDIDSDECFMKALKIAEVIFNNVVKNTISKIKAKSEVEKEIKKASDGIMCLERFLPWKEYLVNSNIEKAKAINFVIYPSNRRRI